MLDADATRADPAHHVAGKLLRRYEAAALLLPFSAGPSGSEVLLRADELAEAPEPVVAVEAAERLVADGLRVLNEALAEACPPARELEVGRLITAHFPERLRGFERLERVHLSGSRDGVPSESTRLRPAAKPGGAKG